MRLWCIAVAGMLLFGPTLAIRAADQGSDQSAKIEQLQKQLDELTRQLPRGRGRGRGDGQSAEQRRETFQKIQELRNQITRLRLGPELAAKYDAYLSKRREMMEKYRTLREDRSLDEAARNARRAELRKEGETLRQTYSEVIARRDAIESRRRTETARTRQLAGLKTALKTSDEEWQVLQPRLDEVVRIQGELRAVTGQADTGRTDRTGRFSGFRVRGMRQRTGGDAETPRSVLSTVLEKEDAAPAEIQAKIDAVRKARQEREQKAEALRNQLKVARDRLRELLSVRQEGTLIVRAVLD